MSLPLRTLAAVASAALSSAVVAVMAVVAASGLDCVDASCVPVPVASTLPAPAPAVCAEFRTQADAQLALAEGVPGLDVDGDGIACERSPVNSGASTAAEPTP